MVSNTLLSTGGGVTTWIFVGLLVVLVVVLLVVPMFTNKKRAKQTMDLHNSLIPGDVIKTVGGIIGTIKEIKQISPSDREMIIETGDGDNKTTMTFDIQALYQILERAPRPESHDVFTHEEEKDVAPETENSVEKPAEPEHAIEDIATTAAEPVEEKSEPVEEKPVEPAPAAEEAAVADEKAEPVAEEAKTEEVAAAEDKPAAKKTSTAKKTAGTSTAKKSTGAKNSAKK